MSCDELKEYYELYAIGVLELEERREIEEHLARDCALCQPGVRRARQLMASVALAAPEAEPPRRLRRRVLALVEPAAEKPSGVNWLTHAWATLAILMFVAVVWFISAGRSQDAQMAGLERRLTQVQNAHDDLAARNRLLGQALALVNLPDAAQLVFGSPDQQPPRGRVWVHAERGVLLLASRLPLAPTGKIYQMWIVPKKGAPIPAGLFNSDERGEAFHVWPRTVDVPAAAAVAVTLEPEGGVAAPTTTPLIAASF